MDLVLFHHGYCIYIHLMITVENHAVYFNHQLIYHIYIPYFKALSMFVSLVAWARDWLCALLSLYEQEIHAHLFNQRLFILCTLSQAVL